MITTAPALLVLCAALSASPPEIVAHRGESADAPENTMAAFRLAWERKVPAIELDVHLSKDGKLVVIHDKDTKRTANVKKVIKESTWDELKDIDVGAWKDAKYKGEKLCILEDALATIPKGARCFIEIKVGAEATPALVKAVKGSGKSNAQLCVISFQADAVEASKKALPDIPAYYLASFKQDKETKQWTPTIEEVIATAKEIKADGVDLSYKGPIDEALVKKVRDAGLGLYFWTVDEEGPARQLVELGADGITTNKGEWLGKILSQPAGK
ncbi:Glycerophosphoryl diester phosphodiesterase [Caulifigura coniformis]|uniref:Glycerophosphoryl diester phosphodiesterase n=1 Tax=Caulifigura coniformis TaxID=2527983 RepID=A0A517S9K0_9PLAN|nr:glycerophosphodiester phosphodiesterase [Caulifigura coniformis]QDT52807.1 Glycerophosphoryl diester phosphodiesterase [Caulifigura coniformis]